MNKKREYRGMGTPFKYLVAKFYPTIWNILFNRIFIGNFLSLSKESHINLGAPTIWSIGTKPQNLES
jgi:hypothetical protein